MDSQAPLTDSAKAHPIYSTGETAERIRRKDWSATPLGPISTWSTELLAYVNTMLCAPTPMMLFWGPELTLLYNDHAKPLATRNHADTLGRSAREVWKEAWPIVGDQVERAFEFGTGIRNESVLVPLFRQGVLEDIWFDYSYGAVFDSKGIAGVLVIPQDVTKSVLARRDLATMAARLEQVLNATTDGIISIDRNWRVKYLNPPARRVIWPIEDLEGKNIWETFPAMVYENSPYVEHYYRAMNEGITGEFEAYYPEPLNIWVSIQARPSEDGIVVFFRDITEQKKTAAALLQSEKLAAVGRLAASIAHEINNPLASVTNLLYLARGSSKPEEIQKYLEVAERELHRVAVITNQTLRFYKQSGNPRQVSCEDLLESVLSIYERRLESLHIEVEQRLHARRLVECLDGEIRQVLNNLVANAIDAMQSRGGRLLVRSRVAHDWKTGRRGLVLTVADTGLGMPRGILGHIFDPFYTTKGNGGNGLGLWVSQQIVDRHEGKLAVRSRQAPERSGTVFQLFLPFAE